MTHCWTGAVQVPSRAHAGGMITDFAELRMFGRRQPERGRTSATCSPTFSSRSLQCTRLATVRVRGLWPRRVGTCCSAEWHSGCVASEQT
jgi:hypothetical protein